MARSLLFCAMLCVLLTACGRVETQIVDRPVEVAVHVPAYLRFCPEVPKPGVTEETDQREVADYIVRLYGVARECHTKLRSVDQILAEHAEELAAP